MTVTEPHRINAAFAEAYNSRDVERVLVLFEDDAILRIDATRTFRGHAALREAFAVEFARLPGRMTSRNNFCIVQGDIALLRADFVVVDGNGAEIASGSTAEVARRQRDGSWRYIIDHAAGASLPRDT